VQQAEEARQGGAAVKIQLQFPYRLSYLGVEQLIDAALARINHELTRT